MNQSHQLHSASETALPFSRPKLALQAPVLSSVYANKEILHAS